jgi:hypothetical protein
MCMRMCRRCPRCAVARAQRHRQRRRRPQRTHTASYANVCYAVARTPRSAAQPAIFF